MNRNLISQAVAEFIGTFFLVFFSCGAIVLTEVNTNSSLGQFIPVIFGLTVAVMIYATGHISGAHFNPAVSFAFVLRRTIAPHIAVLYVLWQIIGGLCGTVLAHLMFEEPLFQISLNLRSGPAQYASEFIATFGLLAVIFGGIRFTQTAIPWLVGLYITAAYWFTASTSFANPAVTIARSFTDSFSGISPTDMPFFIIAQLLGAAVASLICGWLFAEQNEK